MVKWRAVAQLFSRAGRRPQSTYVVKSPFEEISFPQTTVSHLIWEKTERFSDRTALLCAETGESLTYSKLRRLSSHLSTWMYDSVGKGNVLTVILPNSIEFGLVTVAALQSGVVLSSLNPDFTKEEISRLLTMTKTHHVVTSSFKIPTVLEAKNLIEKSTGSEFPLSIVSVDDEMTFNGVEHFEFLLKHEEDYKGPSPELEDTALLLHINNQRGLPQPVKLSYKNIIANCVQMSAPQVLSLRDDEQSVVAALMPMFHNYGLTHVLVNGLLHGAKIVTLSKFRPKHFLKTMKSFNVTVLPTVSSMVGFLSSGHVTKEDLSGLQNITIGGAPAPYQELSKLLEIIPRDAHLVQLYGLSEGSIIFHQPKGTIKMSSIGQLLPSTEAKVVDQTTGEELPPRKEGEICVRGPQVMRDYSEYGTAQEPGWLHTGDLGYYDKDGFFYLTGKLKDSITVNGFPVCPAELESVLRAHPEVVDAAVFGILDKKSGECVVAVIVPQNLSLPPMEREIRNFLAGRVAPYKHISYLYFVPHIPRLSNGKVDRENLPLDNKNSEFVAMTFI